MSQLETGSDWDFSELKLRLKKVALAKEPIQEKELPEVIDFGIFAREGTFKVAAYTKDHTNSHEFLRAVGFEKDPPSAWIFSTIQDNGTMLCTGAVVLSSLFTKDTLASLYEQPIMLAHSHPLACVMSVPDTINTYVGAPEDTPYISAVGALPSHTRKGFGMYAFRTERTIHILQNGDPNRFRNHRETAVQALLDLDKRYPDYSRMIKEYTQQLENKRHASEVSEDVVRALNDISDPVLRAEAQRQGLVYYLSEFGQSVARRCNLSRPLYPQLFL